MNAVPQAQGARYTVKPKTVLTLGAGAYVVVDGVDGSEWGLTIWRDEAEKLAALWNAHEMHRQDSGLAEAEDAYDADIERRTLGAEQIADAHDFGSAA